VIAKVASFLEDGIAFDRREAGNKNSQRLATGVHLDGLDPDPMCGWLPVQVFEELIHKLRSRRSIAQSLRDPRNSLDLCNHEN
jgi:hypothetical protein